MSDRAALRWTHKGEADHAADPKYQANGQPAYWVCHDCRTIDTAESPMSAQP